MKNIRKISLMLFLLSLYKVDGLLGSSVGADTVQTIEQRVLTKDESALFEAIEKGNLQVVQFLCNKRVNPNIKDPNGFTPLMVACFKGNENIVRALINAGADRNIQSNKGSTATMIACSDGFEHIVQMLLEAGANPNIQNNKGKTPLMVASNEGYGHAVQMLLGAGADPNVQDNYGDTALLKAFRTLISGFDNRFMEDIIRKLLDAGADPSIRNSLGETALGFCKSSYLYLLVLKSMLVKGNIPFTKDYKQRLCEMRVSGEMTASSQKSINQILSVFDALNVDLEEKMLCLRDEPKADIQEFKSAYESFINGDHDLLRDLLLRRYVAYDALSKKSGTSGFRGMRDSMINIVIFCVKKESIKSLLYFLCRTKQERVVADAILADISEEIESEQKTIEAILADIKQPIEVERRGTKRER